MKRNRGYKCGAAAPLRGFAADEQGGMTALGLYLFTATAMVAGIALDVANVMTERTHLQVTADASAHAALFHRERRTAAEARDEALQLAAVNLPRESAGEVLVADDIEFGTWDFQTHSFTADPAATQAVRVRARRSRDSGNPIPTYLLRMVGLDAWSVNTTSIFAGYLHPCFREGLVAQGRISVNSNNEFGNGFCVHSNDHVEFNNHNSFESGTVVSMPDLDMLGLPGSGFRHNDGLEAALREGAMDIRIVDRIPEIIAGLDNGDDIYLPDYITNSIPITLESHSIGEGDLEPGRMYRASCGSGGTLSIDGAITISEVVLVTDCKINFGANSTLTDTIFATTSAASDSVHGAADVNVGLDDDCAEGGGAQLLTMGGMHFAAKLGAYGGQLLARDDIFFAAQADVLGGTMTAGGEITGTSNLEFAHCGSGMEDNFEALQPRLVNFDTYSW